MDKGVNAMIGLGSRVRFANKASRGLQGRTGTVVDVQPLIPGEDIYPAGDPHLAKVLLDGHPSLVASYLSNLIESVSPPSFILEGVVGSNGEFWGEDSAGVGVSQLSVLEDLFKTIPPEFRGQKVRLVLEVNPTPRGRKKGSVGSVGSGGAGGGRGS